MHRIFWAGAIAVALVFSAAAQTAPASPARGAKPVRTLLDIRDDKVVRQHWDLSCGAAAIATLLTYQLDDPVGEREVALALVHRTNPLLVQRRLGFSLLDLKGYAETRGFTAVGYGGLDLDELIADAPAIVPIRALGFNHFVVFRGRAGDRIVIADPAFGNRTMTVEDFMAAWANRLAFVVFRPGDTHAPNRMGVPAELLQIVSAPAVRASAIENQGGLR